MKKRWKTLFGAFCVVLGLGLLLETAPFAVAQQSNKDEFTLEEITVTATKRQENQQKVGIAMDVVTGEQMKQLGRYDIDQILENVSTAFVQRTADGLRIGIRGVTYDTPAGYGDGTGATPGTASVNIDGVFTQRKQTGTGLFDMDRVEVLFGPQTTTYASNAPAGIVNIELAKPKLDTYELSGTFEAGNYHLLHAEAVVNAPVGKTLALRAAYNGTVRDGYIDNGGDDEDSKAGRIRALWSPNEKLSVLLSTEYQTSISRGMSTVNGFKDESDVRNPWHSNIVLTGLPTNTKNTKFWGNIDWDFGFATLTLIPNRSDDTYYRTSTSLQADGTTAYSTSEGDGYEEGIEARISSPADSHITWLIVYNYYQGDVYRYMVTDYAVAEDDITEMYLYLKNQCILGNMTVPLTDTFRVKGGLRYSSDEALSTRTLIQGFGRDTYSDMKYSSPDYSLGVEYDVNDNSMLYAEFTTSYRVEQEAMQWDGTTLPPQKEKAYTIGSKNRFFDNHFQLNASAYYYDYKNRISQAMQFPTFNPMTGKYCDPNASPGDPNFSVPCISRPDEGGRVPADLTIKGVDVQTTWIISNQDRLDLSISYLNSWIDKMIANYEFKDQPYSQDYDFSNREPTFSPDWTINLVYAHNFLLPNGAALTARLDSRFQSEYQIDWWESRGGLDLSGYITQKAHHIDNATLVYNSPDGKWSLSAYVKNLMDYAEKRFLDTMGGINMNIGAPRTYGAILSVRY